MDWMSASKTEIRLLVVGGAVVCVAGVLWLTVDGAGGAWAVVVLGAVALLRGVGLQLGRRRNDDFAAALRFQFSLVFLASVAAIIVGICLLSGLIGSQGWRDLVAGVVFLGVGAGGVYDAFTEKHFTRMGFSERYAYEEGRKESR